MDCKCHGEPAYWHRDVRCTKGGYWYCAVKEKQRQVAAYDNNPVWRISKNLKNDARKRRQTIERRRSEHGALQV